MVAKLILRTVIAGQPIIAMVNIIYGHRVIILVRLHLGSRLNYHGPACSMLVA